ncbi:MAG: histidinol phosphate phosphatase domain-containing protein, partial [Proteobacteria bacterium]|nr:histidinol phosphate phosphatase domain-containing protein [Pseudomonadota bacterium]
LVIVHGETVTEPVAPGTNAAAVRCLDVDILAHPGLLSREDAEAAAESGVLLEITARRGHSAANGRVARMARETGAGLVINTDAHEPKDLISRDHARVILTAAGLEEDGIQGAFASAEKLLRKVTGNG